MKRLSQLKRTAYLLVARYFQWWADMSLRRWKPRIIAVTGSVGKTTMLHLIEQQLGKRAHYSHNANSAFGIAFDIVGLRGVTGSRLRWLWLLVAVPARAMTHTYHNEFYVVEIDGERPDEVNFVASWLYPEVTLWVSLGNSHAVYFDKQVASGQFATLEQAIAHEFARLPAKTTDYILYNGDEPLIDEVMEDIYVRSESVSLSELSHYKVWANRSEFTLGEHVFHFSYPMPREIALQLGMLIKLLAYLEVRPDYIMPDFTMPPGRNSYFEGIESTHLIDSSYNAHLISMQSMIDMFDSIEASNKWLVLGDMIEQGSSERDQHEKLAERVRISTAERVILIGCRMRRYTTEILSEQDGLKVTYFDSPREALDYIRTELSGGETILFKGSQYLEWLVENLLKNPSDKNLLCRQDPAPAKQRKKRGLL